MVADDLPQVINLCAERSFLNWTPEQLARTLTESYTIALSAFCENQFVGFALFHQLADEAELLAIAVFETWARQGIGKILFYCGMGRLKNNGVEKIFWEVRDKNLAAIAFYESLGAVRIGKRLNYYSDGETAVFFCKNLKEA